MILVRKTNGELEKRCQVLIEEQELTPAASEIALQCCEGPNMNKLITL